jgi:hypothetical protein
MTSEEQYIIDRVRFLSNQLNALLKESASRGIPVILNVINGSATTCNLRLLKPVFFEKQTV